MSRHHDRWPDLRPDPKTDPWSGSAPMSLLTLLVWVPALLAVCTLIWIVLAILLVELGPESPVAMTEGLT